MKDNSYIALWSLAEKHQFINTRTLSVWVFMNYFTIRFPQYARVCLKNHSCHLHAPLCGRFAPNSGYIARYAPFIWHKSPTKCDAHLTKSIFKTRSSQDEKHHHFTRLRQEAFLQTVSCGHAWPRRPESVHTAQPVLLPLWRGTLCLPKSGFRNG